MTATTERAASSDQSDRERFSDILAVQRAAYLRDGAPTLAQRRSPPIPPSAKRRTRRLRGQRRRKK
jgi:hypothetical protein